MTRAVAILVVCVGCGPAMRPMPGANVETSIRPFITGDIVELYVSWQTYCYSTTYGRDDPCQGQPFTIEAACTTQCRAVPDHNPVRSATTVHVRPLTAGTMSVTVTLRHLTTHETFTKQLEFEADDPESLDLRCPDELDNLRAPCEERPLAAYPIPWVEPVAMVKGFEFPSADRLTITGDDPTRATHSRVSLATLFPERMIRGQGPGDERRMEPGRYGITVSFGDLRRVFELEVR